MVQNFTTKNFLKLIVISVLIVIGGCAKHHIVQDGAPPFHIDLNKIPNPVPHPLPHSKAYNPKSYVAKGHRYYVLKTEKGYCQRGIASWYGMKFQGHYTSTNDRYNVTEMTAASKVLPIPCYVRVTNLKNNRSVIVKVNDRGPFVGNRILDLSYVAAAKLGYAEQGTALVQVTAIDYDSPRKVLLASTEHRTMKSAHQATLHSPISYHASNTTYLQLGAFSHFANAEKLKNKVHHMTSKPTYITAVSHNHHEIYRVEIGPMSIAESDHIHARLRKAGLGDAMAALG